MKKYLTIPIITIIILLFTAVFCIHSKAEMQTEDIPFSLESQKGITPSAYCINADGTRLSDEYSYSGYFCIPGKSDDSINIMIYEGDYAYCIGTHKQKSPLSVTDAVKCTQIDNDDEKYRQLISALYAGTSENPNNLSNTDMYYITQCALRTIRYNLPEDMLAFYDTDGNPNEQMTSEYKRILSASHNRDTVMSGNISVNDKASVRCLKIIDNTPFYLYGPFYPEADFNCESFSVTAEENNNNILLTDSNFTIHNEELKLQTGEAFYVMLNSKLEKEINISVRAMSGYTEYIPVVYLAKNDSYQDIIQLKKEEKTHITETKLNLRNSDVPGTLTIHKIFKENEIPLEDHDLFKQPRFTVKLASENLYAGGINTNNGIEFSSFSETPTEFSLDEKTGTFTLYGLPTGEYIICESQGADGYDPENAEQTISVNSQKSELTFVNSRTYTPETTTACTEKLDLFTTQISQTETTKPETITIILTNSPKTGDTGPARLFISLFAAISLIFLLYKKK